MAATHAALIRGINVGGNNKVPMAPLREALTSVGLADVRTYIQSGNVLVDARERTAAEVTALVSEVLRAEFGVETPVVTVTADALRSAVVDAPEGFGQDAAHRWDVIFLRETLPAAQAHAVVQVREAVDAAWKGESVLYFRRAEAQAGKSYLSRIVGTPEYKHMTIRNWRTTTTLASMLDA